MAVLCPEKRLQQKCSYTEESKEHKPVVLSNAMVNVRTERLAEQKGRREVQDPETQEGKCEPRRNDAQHRALRGLRGVCPIVQFPRLVMPRDAALGL